MAVPDYQSLMRSVLEVLAGGETRLRDLVVAVADRVALSPEDRQLLVPGGDQPILNNRVGWARTYLGKAKLIESPRRGSGRITERGREALGSGERIDNRYLKRFAEFVAFQQGGTTESGPRPAVDDAPPPVERT